MLVCVTPHGNQQSGREYANSGETRGVLGGSQGGGEENRLNRRKRKIFSVIKEWWGVYVWGGGLGGEGGGVVVLKQRKNYGTCRYSLAQGEKKKSDIGGGQELRRSWKQHTMT